MTRRVLITGGTGLLGKELVCRLLDDGYEVLTTTSKIENVTQKIHSNSKLVIRHVDFLNDDQIKDFEDYVQSIGQIDYLINNARSLDFLSSNASGLCSLENLMLEFKVNVGIPLKLINHLIRSEIALKGIINISSQYSMVVPTRTIYENLSDMSPIQYNVSKAALNKLTKELAVRLACQKIRVNGIAYGGIKGRTSDEFVERYEAVAPHSHMLGIDECYGPLKWLMSEDSGVINGQIIEANAGWTLC